MNNTVSCPNCGTEVSMTAAIENEIRREEQKKSQERISQVRANYEAEAKRKDEEAASMRKNYLEHMAKLDAREQTLNKQEEQIQDKVNNQLKEQTPQFEEKITKSLEEKYKERLESVSKVANEQKLFADEAARRESMLIEQNSNLHNQIRQIELDNQRKLVEEKEKIFIEGMQRGQEESKQETLLYKHKLEAVEKQLNETQRKLDQGSQKAQGDVWEKEIGDILQTSFPVDKIEKIQNGARGGDIIHTVISPMGKPAGTMLWEVKNTAKWDASWVSKIKEDQRRISAEFAIIVTRTLPKNIQRFDYIDDVIVTDYQTFPVIAALVRQAVIDMYKVRTLGINVEQNLKTIHDYLTSTPFRLLVQKNLECITRMLQELDNEEKLMAKTRGNLRSILQIMQCSISEMYGELQGILGDKLINLPEFDVQDTSEDKKIYLPDANKPSANEVLVTPKQVASQDWDEDFPF